MSRLRPASIILYVVLALSGLVLLVGVTAGTFGRLFDVLSAVAGICFLYTAVQGLRSQQSFRMQSRATKIVLSVGVAALLTGTVLMGLIIVALRNFT